MFSKDTPSHIVAIAHVESQSAAPASPSSTVSSTLPPISKITSQPSHSHSLATPAIAGIAIAIVIILSVGALIVWLKFKRKRSHKDVPELPTYPPGPSGKAELSDGTTHQPGPSNEKKVPRISVDEVRDEKMQAQIDHDEIQIMDSLGNYSGHGVPVEIGGSEPSRPELEGQIRVIHELQDGELMRSELSTPEPPWRAEMPSPEMVSTEMPSPEIGGLIVGEPSPQLDSGPSPLSSPDSLWSRNRSFSRRPNHGRVDSSDSEGGWTPHRMHSAPTHRPNAPSRINSNESSDSQQPDWARNGNPSSASSRQRPARARFDTSDSETIVPRTTLTSVRPAHTRADSSDLEAFGQNVPQRQRSQQQSRPAHHRLDSKDSAETFEARLEMSASGSPYFPYTPRPGMDRHVEAMPSMGFESSQEALMSPGVKSTRSGLRSPEPLEREVKEEEEENERPSSEASKK